MIGRLTALGRGVPNLVVARRVIHKMVTQAQRYVADETGEALVGLLVPGTHTNGVPTLYVLDTISPDESAVRALHTFQQGDDRQDELIWWLQENWRVQRERRRGQPVSPLQEKWDVPLRYLGDWHKQPGYMIQPSSGDLMTALNWIDDPENAMDFLLAPIVTLDHYPTTGSGEGSVNYVTVPQGDGFSARVDFWYIDRHQRVFLPIIPAIYPDDQLPSLPDYPWHLVDEARFEEESARLTADGLLASALLWDADGEPPLEVCFLTARVRAEKVFLLVTPWNYPKQPPSARVAPFTGIAPGDEVYRVFEQLWARSEPVAEPPSWRGGADSYLVDYVRALEASLGLSPVAQSVESDGDRTPAGSGAQESNELG